MFFCEHCTNSFPYTEQTEAKKAPESEMLESLSEKRKINKYFQSLFDNYKNSFVQIIFTISIGFYYFQLLKNSTIFPRPPPVYIKKF